jgi:hypothetical protein
VARCRATLEFRPVVQKITKPLSLLATVAASTASAANGPLAPHLPPHLAPQLVVMAPIIVPIVGSDRLDGALHLKLVLAAADAAALERLTARLPVLRAVSIASAIEFSRLYASPRTAVNAAQLRSELIAALHAEDSDVADILIIEVSAVA